LHQLGHTQICTSPQADNHASNPPLSFLQGGCTSCCPTTYVDVCNRRTGNAHMITMMMMMMMMMISDQQKTQTFGKMQ